MYRALMCAAAALFISGQAVAQTLKEQLAGIWTYVSSEITLPNGTTEPSRFGGANVKGIFILDASGRYADIEMRPDRPRKASISLAGDELKLVGPSAFGGNVLTEVLRRAK